MSKIITIRINEKHEEAIEFIKNYYINKYPEFDKISTSDVIKNSLMSYQNIIKLIRIMEEMNKK